VLAYRYQPRAVRHVGATKVFYACQMRVLVSDLTLNSLDDPRDRLAFESNPSLDSKLHAGGVVQVLRFRWLFRANARCDDLITRQCPHVSECLIRLIRLVTSRAITIRK
ncbi:hypothetical protein X777_14603, partial [Ooceraea biroi]